MAEGGGARAGFGGFLARAFGSLAEARPELYLSLVQALRGHPVALEVDAESTGVQVATGGSLAVGPIARPAVRVFTSGRAILRLIDGEVDLREAVLGGTVDLQGTSDDLIVFDRALHIFMSGAVRVRRIRDLLAAYRHQVQATGGEAMPSQRDESQEPKVEPKVEPKEKEEKEKEKEETEYSQNVGSGFPGARSRQCVTIFGAGVTGLSVAHELVERGFRVQVWERRADVREPDRGCEVGGLACSQWGSLNRPPRFPLPPDRPPMTDKELEAADRAAEKLRGEAAFWRRLRTSPISTPPYRFLLLGAETAPLKVVGEGIVGGAFTNDVAKILEDLVRSVHERRVEVVYAEGLYDKDRYEKVRDGGKVDVEREVRAMLVAQVDETAAATIRREQPVTFPLGALKVTVDGPNFKLEVPGGAPLEVTLEEQTLLLEPENARDWIGDDEDVIGVITFRVREYRIPGEHGYRFFPAFYWHLFDTMKRTPILEAVPKSPVAIAQERAAGVYRPDPQKLVATGRTVYDNLSPAANQAIVFADGFRPSLLPRYQAESFEQLLEIAKIGLRGRIEEPPPGKKDEAPTEPSGLGITPRDVARFQLRLAKFVSSCPARRRQYERMSWWDFLEADSFSPAFQAGQNEWPRALVAMSALEVDARTHGNAVCQLLIDLTRPRSYRDGVLNGPTTESWLVHWKRYLEAQGVEFIHGELLGLRWREDGGARRLVPEVEACDPRHPRDEGSGLPYLMDGYFVLALPVQEAQRLVLTMDAAKEPVGRDINRLKRMPLGTWNSEKDPSVAREYLLELEEPRSDGSPLRNFHGIQFYFHEALNWLDGHLFYAQSQWGLSSISQLRYWQDRQGWEDGYRGILSVIIGVWDKPGSKDKTAWQSPPDELAAEVWHQIEVNTRAERKRKRGANENVLPLPVPVGWHLNDDLEWLPEKGRYRNRSPFLISRPGEWASRPGELPETDPSGAIKEGYGMAYGIVLAGTYMKTYTRLTSMEAANESGRHATNAILAHADRASSVSRAATFPLDDREVPDLQWLKDLDDAHFRRGLPHPLDDPKLEQLLVSTQAGVMRKRAPRPSAGAPVTTRRMGGGDR